MLKPLLILFMVLTMSSFSLAQDNAANKTETPPAEASPKSEDSDKLDIKVLEEKYWSAKDDDFSVIQNRAFSKEKRYFASAQGGIIINDSFTTGQVSSFSGGYFFNERWGVELSYLQGSVSDNDTTKKINDLGGAPDYNKFKNAFTLSANYVPLYAKMSFLDKKILYFDMGISFGIGQTSYDSQIDTGNKSGSNLHYALDITQSIFFTQKWALRFDIKNRWGSQDLYVNHATTLNPQQKSSLAAHDTNIILGFTYFH